MAPLFMTTSGPTAGAARAILVHGFTQTHECWGALPAALAENFEVIRVDAPGHGRSGHDDASLWDAADLLADLGAGTWIGYSMGGRMALHVALAHPRLVHRLVLISATPGIAEAGQRRDRRDADETLAARIETIGTPSFIDEWLAGPLFAGLPREASCRAAREANRPEGLAASLRHAGTGNQDPLWDRLGELTMPVLWLTGADDIKFTEIAAQAAARCLDATAIAVPGAGHTAHLEQPTPSLAAMRDWLTR